MSPENNNDLVEQFISVEPSGKLSHPVNQVTAVSKYLALLLFIILPFIGAYVGYRVAGERVVEVQLPLHTNDTNFDDEIIIEKELPTIPTSQSTSTKKNKSIVYFECTSVENNYPHECVSYGLSATSSPIIKNLTEEAIKQGVIRGRTAIQQEVYTTSDSSMIYFTAGIPESDGCCSLIGFDTKTLKFHKVDLPEIYIGSTHDEIKREQDHKSVCNNENYHGNQVKIPKKRCVFTMNRRYCFQYNCRYIQDDEVNNKAIEDLIPFCEA